MASFGYQSPLPTIQEHDMDPTVDTLVEIGRRDEDSTGTFSDTTNSSSSSSGDEGTNSHNATNNSSSITRHHTTTNSNVRRRVAVPRARSISSPSLSVTFGVPPTSDMTQPEDSRERNFDWTAPTSLNDDSILTTNEYDYDDDDAASSASAVISEILDPLFLEEIEAFGDVQGGRGNENFDNKSCDDSSTMSASTAVIDADVLNALRDSLHVNEHAWIEKSNGQIDPKILLWIKLFHFAHEQRLKKKRSRPYLVVNLFTNVSNVRSDLTWAQDAAHRREVGLPYISYEDYYNKEQNGLVRPYFTYIYILSCIAMMVVVFDRSEWTFAAPNTNPMIGPPPEILLEFGALESRTMIENNEWWRLITPMFLHAGIVHLGINMVAMILMMRIIERSHGFFATAGLFLVSGVAANVVSALLQPGFILVGASGGIFAMFGLMLADIVLNWRLLWIVFASQHWDDFARTQGKDLTDRQRGCYNWIFRFKIVFWTVVDVVGNSLVGLTPYIDNFAHMSGLVYGFLLSSIVLEHLPLSFLGAKSGYCHRLRISCLRFGGAIISIMLMATSGFLLSQSDGTSSPCPRCIYISCIPMPFWKEEGNRWWECLPDECASGVRGAAFRASDDDPFFNKLELYCPNGTTNVTIDIVDEKLDDISEVSAELPDFCRTYC